MALGSMLELLEAGAQLHRLYLFAVVGAKGLTDLDSTSNPAGRMRQAVQPWLLDFGLIVTRSGGGEFLAGGPQGR